MSANKRDPGLCPVKENTDPDAIGRGAHACPREALWSLTIGVNGERVPIVRVCNDHKTEIETDPGRWLLRCGLGNQDVVVYLAGDQ